MTSPNRIRRTELLLLLVLFANGLLAQSGQISRVTDRHVRDRMEAMNQNNAALTTLSDMMGARAIFDRTRAREARRTLIRTTGRIPSLFRKERSDPLSHARPEIWVNWDDFKSHARAAQRAARDLDTGSLPRLRKSLPPLIQTCLACHRAYRSDLR
jgi:cytochrome c556